MIFARLEILVPYSPVGSYEERFTFELPEGFPAEKLTARVRDADAVVQTTDTYPAVFDTPENTEQLLERGLQSLVYVRGITAFRFRARLVGTTARIAFTAYG